MASDTAPRPTNRFMSPPTVARGAGITDAAPRPSASSDYSPEPPTRRPLSSTNRFAFKPTKFASLESSVSLSLNLKKP